MKKIGVFLFLIGVSLSFASASNINKDNWMTHPEIQKIRKLCKNLWEKSNNGVFKSQHKVCVLHDGSVIMKATIFRGKNNVVRKYVLNGGTGDSTAYGEYYYTNKGQLKFSFLRCKASNGSHSERRVYFNDENNIIYEDYRLLEGPGYFEGLSKQLLEPEKDFQELCIKKSG